MSEQELRAMIETASRWCERHFAAKGEIRPTYHAVLASGQEFAMPPPSPDKDTSVALMRAMFQIRDVVRYIFFDEAWMLDKRAGISDADMERIKREGIRGRPDCFEGVMFQGEDRACGQIAARRLIHRPAGGRKAYLGPLEYTMLPGEGVTSEGRMVGMLPVAGMRQ